VLVGAGALLLSVSGCAHDVTASFRVATFRDAGGSAGHTALIGGNIHGRVNDDGTACFWLGSRADRLAMVWPRGSGAERHPLRVVDRFGHTIQRVEDEYSSGGGVIAGAVLGCADIAQHFIR
jgi:hypothetical protein